jgi:hypothetical protein
LIQPCRLLGGSGEFIKKNWSTGRKEFGEGRAFENNRKSL